MLSTIGSIASQGKGISYQNVILTAVGVTAHGPYGPSMGFTGQTYRTFNNSLGYWEYTHNPIEFKDIVLIDGILHLTRTHQYMGTGIGDAGDSGRIEVKCYLGYTDGTEEYFVGVHGTLRNNSWQYYPSTPTTHSVDTKGKTPKQIKCTGNITATNGSPYEISTITKQLIR